jgi:hypothetical protein
VNDTCVVRAAALAESPSTSSVVKTVLWDFGDCVVGSWAIGGGGEASWKFHQRLRRDNVPGTGSCLVLIG